MRVERNYKQEQPKISDRIYYEIISACNLRCIHCSDLLQTSNVSLSSQKILKFHREMAGNGIRSSVVTGGEPTLHKDFEKIVLGLSDLGSVLVTSNGTSIDPEFMVDILNSNQNISLQISMDGINKDTFEEIRGIGVYDQIIELLDYLLDKNLNRQIGISMTIMRQNIDEVYDMICFAREKRLGFVHFPVLLPVGLAKEKWNDIAPSPEQQIMVEELILKEMINDDDNTTISCNRIEQVLTHAISGKNADCIKNFTIKVTPEGNILPCPAASNADLRLGNIDDQGIADSIVELFTYRLKKDYLSLIDSKLTKCADCDVESSCFARFCANCGMLSEPNTHYVDYSCKIVHHHYKNVLKEMNDIEE